MELYLSINDVSKYPSCTVIGGGNSGMIQDTIGYNGVFGWFKHILFMTEHDTGLGRAKKLCLAPLSLAFGWCLPRTMEPFER